MNESRESKIEKTLMFLGAGKDDQVSQSKYRKTGA